MPPAAVRGREGERARLQGGAGQGHRQAEAAAQGRDCAGQLTLASHPRVDYRPVAKGFDFTLAARTNTKTRAKPDNIVVESGMHLIRGKYNVGCGAKWRITDSRWLLESFCF